APSPASHRPHRHPVHRHVDPEADPARRGGAGQREHRALPRHQHLSRPADRAEPADDPHPAVGVPQRADRLLGPRDRAADHPRRGRAGGGVRGAAHHPRPRHVGLGPGRLGGAPGPAAAGPRRPDHLRVAGRRGQEDLRRRAERHEKASPRPGHPGAAARQRGQL
ncbi:MAG: Spore_coat_synthesis_protein_SpsE, partial [uncultured Friedmanniella sp.]